MLLLIFYHKELVLIPPDDGEDRTKFRHTHTAWHAAEVAATYSASADEIVTIGYFFDAHDKAPDPKWKIYPKVLFLSSMLPTKSLSI